MKLISILLLVSSFYVLNAKEQDRCILKKDYPKVLQFKQKIIKSLNSKDINQFLQYIEFPLNKSQYNTITEKEFSNNYESLVTQKHKYIMDDFDMYFFTYMDNENQDWSIINDTKMMNDTCYYLRLQEDIKNPEPEEFHHEGGMYFIIEMLPSDEFKVVEIIISG